MAWRQSSSGSFIRLGSLSAEPTDDMASAVTTALLLRPLWDHFTTGSMSEAFTFTLATYPLKSCALAYLSGQCGSEQKGKKYANLAQTSRGNERENLVVIAVLFSCQHLPQQSDRQNPSHQAPCTCSAGCMSLSNACVWSGHVHTEFCLV